ncbi:hypothetical protein KSP39_PZI018341 [Platanthera zijinensis]|uniref:DUF3527 domain protein n=1 Tax=Platanthera zijinensis TaxID=2320716 RepID=A0AAP0B2U4_9ASPA
MSSNLYSEAAKNEESSNYNCESPLRKVSVRARLPSKFYNERLAATPRIKDAVYVDEARVLRYRRPSGRPHSGYSDAETEVLFPALSSGNYQKPWPSRKGGAGVDELVKYMSSVPYYLQRLKKADSIQEEALNFGVIDWRTLEKWTSSQKTDQKNSVSSSVNKPVLPALSKNQSCSYSSQKNGDSFAQEKKSSSSLELDGDLVRPAEEKPRFTSDHPSSSALCSSHESYHKFKNEDKTSMHTEAGNSTENKMPNRCEKQSSTHDGRFSDSRLGRNFTGNTGVSDPLQASSSSSSSTKSKPLSSTHGDRKAMGVHTSLSMKLPQKSSHHGSVSNMLFQNDDLNMAAATPPTKIRATSPKFSSKNEKGNQIGKSSGNFVATTDEKSQNKMVEGIHGGKKQPLIKHPFTTGLKWLNRSFSLTDMSTGPQRKDTDGLEISDDKERSNSRGRRSPLRRILDPLLKLSNNSLSTGKESSSPNTMIRPSASSTSPSKVTFSSHGLLHEENHSVPMKQALVKLAWKNSQPLFMFSTNEDNVLVASMRMTGRLDSDDSGAVYTIVTAKESKKKGGILTGQRNTKSNLLYDVAGRMKVSSSKPSSFDSKNLEISRQFVLVVDKLLPGDESPNSAHSSELAAIVIKAPYQKLKGSIYNSHINSLQIEKYPEYARMCSIAAILPSGIHGFSDTGKPSTILERWKSGGSCDCGGWDEGCRLTVLTDRIRQTKISGSVPECPSTNGFNHVELFTQGTKGENKHDFSMIAFKEGLYTVEFGSSVASLQAFAICISTLHSISSIHNPPGMNNSMKSSGGLPGYEPHHPPFSPVGRS